MKRTPPVELPRLRDLPPDDDLVRVAELIQAAAPLPDLAAGSRQRIRASLRRDLAAPAARRPRWAFRLSPVAVVVVALISASVVGAAVRSMLVERRLQRQDRERERISVVDVGPGKSPRHWRRSTPAGVQDLTAPAAVPVMPRAPVTYDLSPASARPGPLLPPPVTTAPAAPETSRPEPPETSRPETPRAPAPASVAPTSPPPVTLAPTVAPPTAPLPSPDQKPTELAMAVPRKPAPPEPATAVPVVRVAPSSSEADLLADAIRKLRRNGDANDAVALLEQHRLRLAAGPLAPEAAAVRIEALLRARRTSAALAELDRLSLDGIPGREAWRIVRGELRGSAGRWGEAEHDFSLALTGLVDLARDDLVERALWGRSLARARLGDAAGARDDETLYLRRFPRGRFAVQAERESRQPTPGGRRAP